MISPNFTVEDIHEVRRQLYEETKGMTLQQFLEYVHSGATECKRLMAVSYTHLTLPTKA